MQHKFVVFILLLLSFAPVALAENDNFTSNSSSLAVTTSGMGYAIDDGSPTIFVFGKIRNNSSITLNKILLEVQFFDSKNKPIDVSTNDLYGVTVPPNGEVEFRWRAFASKPENLYASNAVRVIGAEAKIVKGQESILMGFLWNFGPLVLLILLWVYFMRAFRRKDSPQRRSLDLLEKQTAIFTEQNELLAKLVAAIEERKAG